jgi:hypothetical protein
MFMESRTPLEIIDASWPFLWKQLPPLVMPLLAVHETSFVHNVAYFAPSIARKSAFPRWAETLQLECMSKPFLNSV